MAPADDPSQLTAPQPQHNALSLVGIFVALGTECDQILFRILSEVTSWLDVMHLEFAEPPAVLATPTVPLQYLLA